jgi:DNA invertase Pin-like site-specific DNA recombinase
MIIGYGRTSTIEQVAGLEAQIRDLKAAGAEKLFRENVSSVAPRKQLEAAIEFALSRRLTAWRARSGICAKSLMGCR